MFDIILQITIRNKNQGGVGAENQNQICPVLKMFDLRSEEAKGLHRNVRTGSNHPFLDQYPESSIHASKSDFSL